MGDQQSLYWPCQFSWHLHSIAEILAQLIVAWFMQWNGKDCIHRSKNILSRSVCSTVAPAHCVYNGEMLFQTSVPSGASAVLVKLTSISAPPLTCHRGLNSQCLLSMGIMCFLSGVFVWVDWYIWEWSDKWILQSDQDVHSHQPLMTEEQ
jgi:hypothetical protein